MGLNVTQLSAVGYPATAFIFKNEKTISSQSTLRRDIRRQDLSVWRPVDHIQVNYNS